MNRESMNTHPASIIVDSCQYTPIYLVQDTGAIQGKSYIVTQGNVEDAKPVTDNLKRFYENSGIFENNVENNVSNITKPRILKRQDNKLKLAGIVLPKSVNCNIQENYVSKQCLPVSNVILKPANVAPSFVNNVAKVEVSRKIVKLKNFPNALKTTPRERISPKIKPKGDLPIVNPTKHTSVQWLKLGDKYHSLNQLSGDQMKIVNQAMKIYSNAEKTTTLEPSYDPVTNTCFMYKVITPKDRTIVAKNKIVIKHKKEEIKREPKKVQEKEIPYTEPEIPAEIVEEEPEPPVEIKMTRSGRKVKFPKQMVPETPHKPKKKTVAVVSCFQCATEFCSLYRLQKHYENHPTHIPAKVHSNLFHCLLAIIKSGSEEDRTNIFIQQLEQLIEKLKSLIPCLMKKIDGSEGKSCTINDDIGRLFGMNPGKYNLNMEALTCVKDKDGNCRHNPPTSNQIRSDPSSPSQLWQTKHNDDMAKVNLENEIEDCARISSVDKWPTAQKRLNNSKLQKTQHLKRMKLATEIQLQQSIEQQSIAQQPSIVQQLKIEQQPNIEPDIQFGIEDLVDFGTNNDQSAINVQQESLSIIDNLDLDVGNESSIHKPNLNENQSNIDILINQTKKSTSIHNQFHSTHFDIRSSPIKSSPGIFHKFQINPEKIGKYDVQIIRPLDLNHDQVEISKELSMESMPSIDSHCDTSDLQSIFRDDLHLQLSPCKEPSGIPPELNFDTSKDWIIETGNDKSNESLGKDWIIETGNDKSNESFSKTNSVVEPSLLHVQPLPIGNLAINNLEDSNELGNNENHLLSSRSSSVLNFLESLSNECLSYPETDIRNNSVENVDFQLDLFSFSNT